jgi:DNA-binding transcriptional MerR regulator
MSPATNQQFSISELAKEFEVTARTIRFYEDQGLLTPQRTGNAGRQRVYSVRDRTRLKLTLRGKRLGLSLAQIRDLIDMYDSPSDTTAQLGKFLEVLAQHKRALLGQLNDLHETIAEIEAHENRARQLLASAHPGAIHA